VKIIDCEQNTPEWHVARLGIPTASNFGRILTPTGKPSTQAEGYRLKLLAEWLMGQPTEERVTEWMASGAELEAEARAWYEMETGQEIIQAGFCLDDSGTFGCSPDGLIAGGGIEIKCPAPNTHVGYLLGRKLPTEYIPQVQGSMLVTGAQWWTFVSYHPDLPPLRVLVERDQKYIDLLRAALTKFLSALERGKQDLRDSGYIPMEAQE